MRREFCPNQTNDAEQERTEKVNPKSKKHEQEIFWRWSDFIILLTGNII